MLHKLNRDSLMYRWLTTYCEYHPRDLQEGINSCDMVLKSLWRLMIVIGLVLLSGILTSALFVDMFMWFGFMVVYGLMPSVLAGEFGAAFPIAIGVAWFCNKLSEYFDKQDTSQKIVFPETSLPKKLYNSFKEKYCFVIKLED